MVSEEFGGKDFSQLDKTGMLQLLPLVHNLRNFNVIEFVAVDSVETVMHARLAVGGLKIKKII